MSLSVRPLIALTATAALTVLAGCSTDTPAVEQSPAPAPATAYSTATSSAPPSSEAAVAQVQLPSGWEETTNGLITTACTRQGASTKAGQVFDVQTGDWLDVPARRAVDEGTQESEQRCAIVGDSADPVVIYGSALKSRASGVRGESVRAELYGIKVKGGSAADAVDLTNILTPGAKLRQINPYPGGFVLLEWGLSDNLTHIGVKLVSMGTDLKPSVSKVLVKYPSQLGARGDSIVSNEVLLSYEPLHLKAPSVNVVKLPGGERVGLPDQGELIHLAGRFAIFRDERGTATAAERPVKIMDTASGKVVTTPIATSALSGLIQNWGDLVRVGKSYVVDMSTGKVLLDSTKERNPAPNTMAGKYLYVHDGLKNPVIDLLTGETVHEGWTRRPVSKIKGWTIVANTDTLGPQNFTLVRDNQKGEYPGPWW